MGDVITAVAHAQVKNLFASTKAEDLAIECLRVTLDGAAATIYCNHLTKSSINTVAVRTALLVIATPSNAAAYAEDALKAGAVISKTTFTGDTITLHGITTGVYDVLIIGRTP